MKRLLYVFVVILAVFLISCNVNEMGSEIPPDGYRVISDVASIEDEGALHSRSLQTGAPIIGVLLVFDGDDAFYIEYLDGDVRKNGDGMEYNYILHVPAGIARAYREGGGHNPNSGNPFWWYMSECFNLFMNEIMSDYSTALDKLLGKVGSTLPVLGPEDVRWEWKDDSRFVEDNIKPVSVEKGRLILLDPEPTTSFFGHNVSNQNKGPFVDKTGYRDIIQGAFFISPAGKLWFPVALVDVYEEYSGERTSSGDPLWKYLEVYFDISFQDVREEGMDQVLAALRARKDNLPYPDAEKYKEYDKKPQTIDLSAYEAYFQNEYENIELESEWKDEGSVTRSLNIKSQRTGDWAGSYKTREKAYTTFSFTDYPEIYYPVALDYVESQINPDYSGSGDALWDYIKVYYPDSGITIDTVEENGLEWLMKFLLEQSQSPEGLAFPDIEDYRRVLGVV